MGNHRFRLSDMIPNAWFYKLRDMSSRATKTHVSPMKKNQNQAAFSTKQDVSQPRQSYYYTREAKPSSFLDPPGRSRRKTIYRPSPEDDSDTFDVHQWFSSGKSQTEGKLVGYDTISDRDLPPILTKLPGKSRNSGALDGKEIEARGSLCVKSPSRKSFSQSTGVKLRGNSPRIGNRKTQSRPRKSLSSSSGKRSKPPKMSFSGSFAVVKASTDPEKDFRESMTEMIEENNITASKDLEELLACYLSLNSDEYHGHIIKAFQQIWFNLADLHL